MTFGKAGRSQCRACRRRRSPHKIKAGKTKTGENAQRKAVGDIAATDFPNARRAHALLSCRFSRQNWNLIVILDVVGLRTAKAHT